MDLVKDRRMAHPLVGVEGRPSGGESAVGGGTLRRGEVEAGVNGGECYEGRLTFRVLRA